MPARPLAQNGKNFSNNGVRIGVLGDTNLGLCQTDNYDCARSKIVLAGRQNQHARRVRYPDCPLPPATKNSPAAERSSQNV